MSVHFSKNYKHSSLRKPDFTEFPAKKKQLVNTAWNLFNAYGYKRVTVTEICQVAGVSKVTFYKYFNNKLEVLKTIFDAIFTISNEYFEEIINLDIHVTEQFRLIISMKEEMARWISTNLYMDLKLDDEELGPYMRDLSERREIILREFFKRGRKTGKIDRKINIDFMVYMIQLLTESSQSEAVKQIYGENLPLLSRDFTRFIFFGISGAGNES